MGCIKRRFNTASCAHSVTTSAISGFRHVYNCMSFSRTDSRPWMNCLPQLPSERRVTYIFYFDSLCHFEMSNIHISNTLHQLRRNSLGSSSIGNSSIHFITSLHNRSKDPLLILSCVSLKMLVIIIINHQTYYWQFYYFIV